jgi:predicted MPP superfamily phosphohydrolase
VRRPGRRAAAAGAAGGLAAAVAWRALWQEPRSDRVRERTLALERWPPELAGLRVALVSDLHAGAPHVDAARLRRLVAAVNRRAPDLVVLLGDFVDPNVHGGSPLRAEAVAEALAGLRARLGTFAVLGNHDWVNGGERVARALRAAGITVLENDAAPAGALTVVGLADARERRPDVAGALAGVPDDTPVIVLSHDPDLFPRIPERVALTLSGHTHGGQVAVPLLRRPLIPSRFGERYARGHVVEDARHLYVTSGFGTTVWPVRLFAPPEAVILALMPAGAPPPGRGDRPRRGRGPTRAAGRRPPSASARRSS